MKKITLLLVDDHTVVRQGLRALLEAEEDMQVTGEAENGRQAVVMAKTVEKHRQQVMDKLNIHEVAGLTRFCLASPRFHLPSAPSSV